MPHPCAASRFFTIDEQRELELAYLEEQREQTWTAADWELWNQRWTLVTDGDDTYAPD